MVKFKSKFRKLVRSPRMFFKDAIRNINSNPTSIEKSKAQNNSNITRCLVDLQFKDGFINIKHNDHPIQNRKLSSIILVDRNNSNFSNAPLVGDMLKSQDNFIGFREKTLFFGLMDANILTDRFYVSKNIQQPCWRNQPFSKVQNIFIVDPINDIPELIRCSSHNIKVHIIFTERYCQNNKIEYCSDSFIVHKSLGLSFAEIRKLNYFNNTASLIEVIKKIILIGDNTDHDYLMPITDNVPYLDEIEMLNSGLQDIVIKLKNTIIFKPHKTFNDVMIELLKSTEYVLARESLCKRYSFQLSNKNISEFIKLAVKDGCRVRVLPE